MTVSFSTIPPDYNVFSGRVNNLATDRDILHPLADIAEIYVLGVDLFEVSAGILEVTFGLIGSGELVPDPLLLVLVQARCFQRATEPCQSKIRHRLLHEAMAEQIRALEESTRWIV